MCEFDKKKEKFRYGIVKTERKQSLQLLNIVSIIVRMYLNIERPYFQLL